MTTQELSRRVNDPSISDETIFENLNEYLADETAWNLQELEFLSDLMRKIRPKVMLKLKRVVLADHKGCCSKDPTE